MNFVQAVCTSLKLKPVVNVVLNFRQISEMPWKRKYIRRYGYISPFLERPDTLPRIKDDTALRNLKKYKPHDHWAEKRALRGQNDYIDILGDGNIHPVQLLTNMPPWLRGFKGNEFQMLLRKQRNYPHWRWSKPTKWKWMNKRVMYLYRYLNRKTKT